MENVDFWQTVVSAVVSFIFSIATIFAKRKGDKK